MKLLGRTITMTTPDTTFTHCYTMTSDPEFLTPDGKQAWTWLRCHLNRANSFWLAFLLTADLTAQRVLRE